MVERCPDKTEVEGSIPSTRTMIKPRGAYFFYLLFALIGVLAVIIFWPFLPILAIAASFAVVLYPIFRWWKKVVLKDTLAAMLTLLVFLLILGLPILFIGGRVVVEAQNLYLSLSQNGVGGYADKITLWLQPLFPKLQSGELLAKLGGMVSLVLSGFNQIFAATISTLVSFLLMILAMFYFLKDGSRWAKIVEVWSPLSREHDEHILSLLARSVNGVVRGSLLVALIQGIVMGFGLFAFSVPHAALWGSLAVVASLIPAVGTALISAPAIIYLFASGSTGGALGLLLWSVILVGGIDNIVRPIIVGPSIALPPLMVLFAVLGGLALFGATGVILGPIILSLLQALITIYQKDFAQGESV